MDWHDSFSLVSNIYRHANTLCQPRQQADKVKCILLE